MQWDKADDIKQTVLQILRKTSLDHIDPARVFIFRSQGSKARAYARIWALPTIWQKALHVIPAYCIEVISEKFDKLDSKDKKIKILIHELLHIPKNFSGNLVQHRGRGKHGVSHQSIENIYREYLKK